MSLITKDAVLKAAFRCKSCGHLHPSAHAGERALPYKCVVCGAGVIPGVNITQLRKDHPKLFEGLSAQEVDSRTIRLPFNMVAFADHDNWQVLADLKPEELTAIDHALKPEHVERHVPFKKPENSPPSQGPQVRTAVDGAGVKDGAS
jgi:hypothetical protein